MLLSEAAATGRRFRRKSVPEVWYWLAGKDVKIDGAPLGETTASIDAEMLISNDWEAEPNRIEVTAEDLLAAARTLSNHPITHQRRLAPIEFTKLLIEELGLGD